MIRRKPLSGGPSRVRTADRSSRRAQRPLKIERLESRLVLTGVVETAAEPSQAPEQLENMVDLVESTIAPDVVDAQSTDAAAIAEVFASELDAAVLDAVEVLPEVVDSVLTGSELSLDGLDAEAMMLGAPSGGPSGGSGPALLPPLIIEFAADAEHDLWRFCGHVLDDKPVAGLTVYFGGLLEGLTAQVDRFGMFELFVTLGPHPDGTATAYTIDGDGLRSETVSVIIC